VASANDSDVFEIKYSSPDKDNAALVVNTVTSEYLAAQEEEEHKHQKRIFDALSEQMKNQKGDVEKLRELVLRKTQEVEGKEPDAVRPDPSSPAKNPLRELQSRLIDVQIQRVMLGAQIKASEEELKELAKSVAGDGENSMAAQGGAAKKAAAPLSEGQLKLKDETERRAVADSLQIKNLKLQLTSKKAELDLVEKRSKDPKNDPLCISRRDDIAIIEKKLDDLQAKSASPIADDVAVKKVPLSAEERVLLNAMVDKALAENLEVQHLDEQLVHSQMELDRLEKSRIKQDKNVMKGSLYLKQKEEVELLAMNVNALKERLRGPIEKAEEFFLRGKRGEGAVGVDNEGVFFAKRREELARMRSNLRSLELAETDLRAKYVKKKEDLLNNLTDICEKNVALAFMKDQLKEKEGVLARITARQIALTTELGAPTRVIWHEEAKAPTAPVELLPYRNMALAGLAGFCLPYVLGFLWLVLGNISKLISKLIAKLEPVE